MTLLNSVLAFGGLAAAIPFIIHILNRSRFKTVDWGAMHLLESVIKVNHKRLQLEQLILLLVRCALPVLLALCMARPVLTGFQALQGNAPVSLAIVLDNSYSMDAVDGGRSRYEQAVDAVVELVSATTRGSEVVVIQSGGKPTPLFDQPTFDPDAVVRKLKQQRPGFGASNMPGAIDEALAALAGMSNARRELLVVSDFQPADWQSIAADASAIDEQIEASSIEPKISLLGVGSELSGNVSVDGLEFSTRPLGVGQRLDVRAQIRNHGDQSIESARAIFRVDGVEQMASTVSLAGDGTSQVLFPHEFVNAGSHVFEVDVVTDDPLPTDNRFGAAVEIWQNIDVLLVDGSPSQEPLKGETDFLAVALTPFSFGRTRLTDLIQTKTVRTNQLNREVFDGARLIVLANVPKLNDDQLAQVTEFVSGGGALLVTAGNKIDLSWYRDRFFNNGQGLLPLPFTESGGDVDGEGQAAKIVSQRFEHPAFEYFNDPAHGDVSDANIRRWYKTADPESVGGDRPVQVAMRLATGDPLFVERPFGEGVVMQMATTCDADWTDLPMRPVFVPLMQQLVATLASRVSPPRNIATGEPAVALLETSEASQVSDSAPLAVTVEMPDGRRRTLETVPQSRRQLARFDDTQRPGVYTMTSPGLGTVHFVAETSRAESRPDVLSNDAVSELASAIGAEHVESIAAYLEQDRLQRHGREIWKIVLIVFLAFLALELLLQQRFARV